MLQRRTTHSLVFVGLLPCVLVACSDDSSITDPLIRTFEARYAVEGKLAEATVQRARPGRPDRARHPSGAHPPHPISVLGRAGLPPDRWHLRRSRSNAD